MYTTPEIRGEQKRQTPTRSRETSPADSKIKTHVNGVNRWEPASREKHLNTRSQKDAWIMLQGLETKKVAGSGNKEHLQKPKTKQLLPILLGGLRASVRYPLTVKWGVSTTRWGNRVLVVRMGSMRGPLIGFSGRYVPKCLRPRAKGQEATKRRNPEGGQDTGGWKHQWEG